VDHCQQLRWLIQKQKTEMTTEDQRQECVDFIAQKLSKTAEWRLVQARRFATENSVGTGSNISPTRGLIVSWHATPDTHGYFLVDDFGAPLGSDDDQKKIEKASVGGDHAQSAPRSRRVLSGLLRCGCCGGGMSIIGSDRSGPRIQCSVFKESGACSNGARYYIEKIERLVIDALRLQLSNPKLIREYVKAYRDERNRVEAEARRGRSTLERELARSIHESTVVFDV
jgi:Recombinase zinc beta ribbon domain